MSPYNKIPLEKVMDVSTVVTAHIYDTRGKLIKGEQHDFPEIFYVMQGTATIFIDSKKYFLGEGQMILYPPNAFHGERIPTRRGTCVAGIISFVSDSAALEELYHKVITLSYAQMEAYLKLLEESIPLFETVREPVYLGMRPKESADPRRLQNMKNLLELFLLDVLQNPDPKSNREAFLQLRFEEAEGYFRSNLHRRISSEQAARELNMSVFFLRSLIKKQKNCGITDYFLQLKVNKAKELLVNTAMNVSEISLALGFSSVHYFSRLFKKKTGLSPLQYAAGKMKNPMGGKE